MEASLPLQDVVAYANSASMVLQSHSHFGVYAPTKNMFDNVESKENLPLNPSQTSILVTLWVPKKKTLNHLS